MAIKAELCTTRREFLASCVALGIASTRAGGAVVSPGARVSEIGLGVVRAVLAFEHPQFPAITPEAIWRRLNDTFVLAASTERVTFEHALLVLDRLNAFADPLLIPGEQQLGPDEWQALVAGEQQAFEAWQAMHSNPPQETFRALSLDERRTYLQLWARSSVVERRRFFRASRALVMVAAYSHELLWQAVGYEGPFRERRP